MKCQAHLTRQFTDHVTNYVGSKVVGFLRITKFVINSLGGGHTNTHTCIQTFADRNNSKKPGAWLECAWFKNITHLYKSYMSDENQFEHY